MLLWNPVLNHITETCNQGSFPKNGGRDARRGPATLKEENYHKEKQAPDEA